MTQGNLLMRVGVAGITGMTGSPLTPEEAQTVEKLYGFEEGKLHTLSIPDFTPSNRVILADKPVDMKNIEKRA